MLEALIVMSIKIHWYELFKLSAVKDALAPAGYARPKCPRNTKHALFVS